MTVYHREPPFNQFLRTLFNEMAIFKSFVKKGCNVLVKESTKSFICLQIKHNSCFTFGYINNSAIRKHVTILHILKKIHYDAPRHRFKIMVTVLCLDFEVSQQRSSVMPWALSYCLIWPMSNPLSTSETGWPSYRRMRTAKIPTSFCVETRQT